MLLAWMCIEYGAINTITIYRYHCSLRSVEILCLQRTMRACQQKTKLLPDFRSRSSKKLQVSVTICNISFEMPNLLSSSFESSVHWGK